MNIGKTIPSPTGGIDSYNNDYAISPIHAYSMINWIPGLREVYIRGGSVLFNSVGSSVFSSVTTLMSYKQTGRDELLVFSQQSLYCFTEDSKIRLFTGFTEDLLLQWLQFNTEAGQFLIFFNGSDNPKIYNGTFISDIEIGKDPNISTNFPNLSDLIWCHVHQNRLWFGAKDSLDIWYMPVSTISGNTAKLWRFNATKGGHIMGMFSWTVNSVDNSSQDVFCFITSEGQLFIYSGNPDDLTTINYIGTYDIGKPVSRRAWTKFGADVLIFTEIGIEAVSQIFGQGQTISDSYEFQKYINPLVKEKMEYFISNDISTIANTIFYDIVNEFIIIIFPNSEQIVINIKNRSSTEFKGLDMNSVINIFGKFIYGDYNGNLLEAYKSNLDFNLATYKNDKPIQAIVITGFYNFETPSREKIFKKILIRLRSPDIPSIGVSGVIDYNYTDYKPDLMQRELLVPILGVNFILGESYLVEPKGLKDFENSEVNLKGTSLGIRMICERKGFEVSWVSSVINYKESEKEIVG